MPITLDSPSMSLNDVRVAEQSKDGTLGSPKVFQMWNTWVVQPTESREHIVSWVATVARGCPGKRLKNLVISCHGSPGALQLGEGFDLRHVGLLAAWRGLVGALWIVGCEVAYKPHPKYESHTPNGDLFCARLAKAVGCSVVAATEKQCDYVMTYPPGTISDFEGLVLTYGRDGRVSHSTTTPSGVFGRERCFGNLETDVDAIPRVD